MDTRPQQSKRREAALSSLNAAIDTVNVVKEALSMTPATAALGPVSVVLTMIKVGFFQRPVFIDCWLRAVYRNP